MRDTKYPYQIADKSVFLNTDDEDLFKIEVPVSTPEEYYNLPYEEAIKKIDGYGISPEKQKFQYQEMPAKLKDVEAVIRKKKQIKPKDVIRLEDIDEELFSNAAYYSKEIIWIKKQIRRHYKGYFFFNNGKPTYIPGCMYTYLNFWPIGNPKNRDGLPEYRDRDRRWFAGVMYSYTTRDGVFKFKVVYTDGSESFVRYFNNKKSVD